ncbi:DUF4369 domain-containing protein [Dyadobacter sp. CY312]|uniref:DUF4369 domain-containing protein n=1 Tax=Dyadobacter sp. CY312 TaxID=2907303 RepID=UPI001F268901|nr:DUF4369 domain-containing protein [Dyadobacter sp. CY312]MCE7043904.1 DUF4369 domain-containing protein [Dyadobacter sp. CY312]
MEKKFRLATRNFALILLFWQAFTSAFSQTVSIKIEGPASLKGRKAILLTREKGFAATVHSVKLTTGNIDLQLSGDLVPDLYQLNVSQMKGALFFFLEPGTHIYLDTLDVSRSVVTRSKSNPDWQLFQETVQKTYDQKFTAYTSAESRARKKGTTDSLNYWIEQKTLEYDLLLERTKTFIISHPDSFVSLYLLKNNWYAFKNAGLLEKLNPALAGHRSYRFLKGKRKG